MRATITRQRLIRSAVTTVSVAFLAACGASQRSPDVTPPAVSGFAAGAMLVSDGTARVLVGGEPVTFPTTVTDAAWSGDGSRIAFVDQDGNISTARPDGSKRVVLTTHQDGVTRSRPTWLSGRVVFEERSADGKAHLAWVAADERPGAVQEYEPPQDSEPWAGLSAPNSNGSSGSGVEIAFQSPGGQGPEVWVADLNQRSPWSGKIADGSEPAVSPDGTKVAYVASNHQVAVVAVSGENPQPVQITFGVDSPSHLAWTPDGAAVAFATKVDVESVSATLAPGAKENQVTRLTSTPGVPTFLRPARDRVIRIAGTDPVATSVAASQSRWPRQDAYLPTESNLPARGAVLLGTGNPQAALSGAMFAADAHGPVLFTGATALDPRAKAELLRTLGRVDPAIDNVPTVFVVGGTDVVSTKAEAEVKAMGYKTRRINGANQYEVAAALRDTHPVETVRSVYVVDGEDTASIAITSAVAGYEEVSILSHGSTLAPGATTFLNRFKAGTKVYAVGPAAAAALAAPWPGKSATFTVVPTTADALSGGLAAGAVVVDPSAPQDVAIGMAVAAFTGSRVVVVDPRSGLDPKTATWLDATSASVNTVYLIDPSARIGSELEAQLGGLVSGPLGYAVATNPAAPPLD